MKIGGSQLTGIFRFSTTPQLELREDARYGRIGYREAFRVKAAKDLAL